MRLAWAFAVVDRPSTIFGPHSNFAASWDQASEVDDLCQLHQWRLWRDEYAVRANGDPEQLAFINQHWVDLPDEIARACVDAFNCRDTNISRMQRDVGVTLEALGLQPQAEALSPQGYSIDFVVRIGGREVAIEVDGPWHYFGSSRIPTGSTSLKRRQLQAFGARLLSIPYWEWAGAKDKQLYVRRRLEEVLDEASPRRSFAKASDAIDALSSSNAYAGATKSLSSTGSNPLPQVERSG